jgi:hypothetical protein
MQDSMALQLNNGALVVPGNERKDLVVAEVAALPAIQAEAEIQAELDRLQSLSMTDPLGSLDQVLSLMQGVNLEMLKCMAPQLMERAHLDAAEFSGRGQLSDQKNGRALASLLRLQEGIAKLGVARVKVRDELVRRGHLRVRDWACVLQPGSFALTS